MKITGEKKTETLLRKRSCEFARKSSLSQTEEDEEEEDLIILRNVDDYARREWHENTRLTATGLLFFYLFLDRCVITSKSSPSFPTKWRPCDLRRRFANRSINNTDSFGRGRAKKKVGGGKDKNPIRPDFEMCRAPRRLHVRIIRNPFVHGHLESAVYGTTRVAMTLPVRFEFTLRNQ